MERLVDVSLADVGRTLYRYRPVVAAGAAIVVLGLALPGPKQEGQDLSQYASAGTSSIRTSVNPAIPQSDPDEGVVEATTAEDSSSMFTPLPPPTPSFLSPSTFDRESSTPSGRGEGSPSGSGSTSPTSGDSTSTFESSSTSAPRRAEITASLWMSQSAGTPLAASGVPEKSFPVGKALGQEDKVTFLRISGSPDRIRLKEHAEGQRSPDTAVIQVCLVKTVGWSSGEAVASGDAPERDCTVSVLGVRSDDGTWSFDLRPFEGRSGDGFSFAPAPDSPLDFQVAFEPSLL